jgi:hypothetical protein
MSDDLSDFVGVRVKVFVNLANGTAEFETVLVNARRSITLARVEDSAQDWLLRGGLIQRTGRDRYVIISTQVVEITVIEKPFDNPSFWLP